VERASSRPALVPVKSGLSPAYLLIPVFLGLFIGLGIGLKDRIAGTRVDRDQSYIVLAATLYGQNPTDDVAGDLRQRLQGLGISNPSSTVLALADDLATSRDPDERRQADGLRMFGEALGGVTGPLVNVPTAAVTPIATATPLGALVVDPTKPTPPPATTPAAATPTVLAAAASPTDSTALSPTPEPTATSTPVPTATVRRATATPTKRATSTPSGGVAVNKTGTASTGTDKNVLLRKGPATSYDVIVAIPNGSKVDVLKKYTGEAILKNQPTWYLVNWRSGSGNVIQGYVYGPLVKLTS
jgi:Bacterial SH3 domain